MVSSLVAVVVVVGRSLVVGCIPGVLLVSPRVVPVGGSAGLLPWLGPVILVTMIKSSGRAGCLESFRFPELLLLGPPGGTPGAGTKGPNPDSGGPSIGVECLVKVLSSKCHLK